MRREELRIHRFGCVVGSFSKQRYNMDLLKQGSKYIECVVWDSPYTSKRALPTKSHPSFSSTARTPKAFSAISLLLVLTTTATPLVKLLLHLNLDISPLTRIVSNQEEPLESFMARDPADWRREHWEREHAAREAFWQTPAGMLTALDALLNAVRSLPASVSQLILADDYFREGFFSQDLADLREMIHWAKTQQIPFVRLVSV